MISTNLLDISVNYSSEGGWTANVMGRQYSRNGVIFDPSFGAGYTYCFVSERSQTPMLPNDDPQSYLMQIETEHPGFEYPDVEVAMPDVEGVVQRDWSGCLVFDAQSVDGKFRKDGLLIWYDGSGQIVASWPALSGSRGLFPIPSGKWKLSNYRKRTVPGFTREGYGFSVDITPDPLWGRTALRIHPDGSPVGTAGCIGLTCNKAGLVKFSRLIQHYLSMNNGIMPLVVTGNDIYPGFPH